MQQHLTYLSDQMSITEADIRERKALLEFGPDDVAELKMFAPAANEIADQVVRQFYQHQLSVPAIRQIIADRGTLDRLMEHMRRYVSDLFCGDYGVGYVESRLRLGRVHARLGISPKYYVSSLLKLKSIIISHLMESGLLEGEPDSLRKLIMLDLELVFDTYVFTLIEEINVPKTNEHGTFRPGGQSNFAGFETRENRADAGYAEALAAKRRVVADRWDEAFKQAKGAAVEIDRDDKGDAPARSGDAGALGHEV